MPRQKLRSFGVRIKLNPVRSVLEGQRVVLIEFPHRGMKAVGLVTRTLRDATGAALEPGGKRAFRSDAGELV